MDYTAEVTLTPVEEIVGTPRITLIIAAPDGSPAAELPILTVDEGGESHWAIASIGLSLVASGLEAYQPPPITPAIAAPPAAAAAAPAQPAAPTQPHPTAAAPPAAKPTPPQPHRR